ncbi:hypothetical protein M433DRAFT_148570 [Acidomyces richmondensis BFW]|nr:MAG: hypothetical protein FE78DRAFT_86997 [Acidomyces sp. 'richmondensis']KYG50643.1 hypothetical protein M433DRAFT_148570 [Acidomyces richmondensis BFW]
MVVFPLAFFLLPSLALTHNTASANATMSTSTTAIASYTINPNEMSSSFIQGNIAERAASTPVAGLWLAGGLALVSVGHIAQGACER